MVAFEPTADRSAAQLLDLHRRLAGAGLVLPLRLWDGSTLGPERPSYRLVLHEPWSLRAMLVPPTDLQVGEAYLRDAVDVEGSMVAALSDIARLRDGLRPPGRRQLARAVLASPSPPKERERTGRARLRGRRHSQRRDAAAIQHHYDVGRELYERFLDPALVYSCAYFGEEDREAPVTDREVLARAQRRKLELVCRKLTLRPGDRLLDIGCGWGALVIHAARHHGVEALGVTLSKDQAEFAQQRVADAGLQGRVEIALRDYREVTGSFDAIASIGMAEHVGADQLATYSRRLASLLAPGGRLLNHAITTGRRDVVRDLSRDRNSFVGRYVFPDGALVPGYQMIQHLEQAGLEIHDVEQLREHYARTTAHWVANIEAELGELAAVVGERTVRVWRAYLAGSSVSFTNGHLGVIQVLASRGDARLPLDRDHLASTSLSSAVSTP